MNDTEREASRPPCLVWIDPNHLTREDDPAIWGELPPIECKLDAGHLGLHEAYGPEETP